MKIERVRSIPISSLIPLPDQHTWFALQKVLIKYSDTAICFH